MSDVAVFNFSNLPSHAKADTATWSDFKAGGPRFNKVTNSNKGVIYVHKDGVQSAGLPSIDIVVVAAHDTSNRVWFEQAYDPNNKKSDPPACWSSDGKTPSAASPKIQASSCASCPKSKAGSGPTIGTNKTAACKSKWSVVVADAASLGNDKIDLYAMTLPGMTAFRETKSPTGPWAYLEFLQQCKVRSIDPNAVSLRYQLDAESDVARGTFQPLAYLSAEHVAAVKAAKAEAKSIIAQILESDGGITESGPVDDDPFAPAPVAIAAPTWQSVFLRKGYAQGDIDSIEAAGGPESARGKKMAVAFEPEAAEAETVVVEKAKPEKAKAAPALEVPPELAAMFDKFDDA